MNRLAAALNIRAGEERWVVALFAYSLVLGFSRIFLLPSQALFLERYGADKLPWVYLITAAATVRISVRSSSGS